MHNIGNGMVACISEGVRGVILGAGYEAVENVQPRNLVERTARKKSLTLW